MPRPLNRTKIKKNNYKARDSQHHSGSQLVHALDIYDKSRFRQHSSALIGKGKPTPRRRKTMRIIAELGGQLRNQALGTKPHLWAKSTKGLANASSPEQRSGLSLRWTTLGSTSRRLLLHYGAQCADIFLG